MSHGEVRKQPVCHTEAEKNNCLLEPSGVKGRLGMCGGGIIQPAVISLQLDK